MTPNAIAAYGLYSRDAVVADIVCNLNQAGFGNQDICMMLSPDHPIASAVRQASMFTAEKAADAGTAALIGWLSEFGAVVIPKVGFFIRSQAFFHALMTSPEASSACGKSRALVGLGFSDEDADRFEDRMRDSGILVYVACTESAKTQWAREVLRHTGAEESSTLHPAMASVAVA